MRRGLAPGSFQGPGAGVEKRTVGSALAVQHVADGIRHSWVGVGGVFKAKGLARGSIFTFLELNLR